jgi:hypothetical protein
MSRGKEIIEEEKYNINLEVSPEMASDITQLSYSTNKWRDGISAMMMDLLYTREIHEHQIRRMQVEIDQKTTQLYDQNVQIRKLEFDLKRIKDFLALNNIKP